MIYMLSHKNVLEQIKRLTADIISLELCNEQNFPAMKMVKGNFVEIGITNAEHSICLKGIPYAEMYRELDEKRQYNLKMLDGALITLLYRFKGGVLVAHRLSFFPAPDLEVFQNEPELYMNDEFYLDILDKRIVAVPLRFDLDADAFISLKHPKSHLTLGQYEHCRIPVSSGISPYQFLNFIIWNFYHPKQTDLSYGLTQYNDDFDTSITSAEREIMHVCIPNH